MPSTAPARDRFRPTNDSTSSPASGNEIDYIASDELSDFKYTPAELELVRELISHFSAEDADDGANSPVGPLMARSLPPLSRDEERVLFRRMNYLKFQAEALRSTLSSSRPAKKKLAKIETLLDEAASIRRRISESHIRLVASITRKHSKSAQEFQEFLSDGLLILLGAIEKFDYARGFRFSTYATHSVQRHFYRLSQRKTRYAQRFVLTPGEVIADVAGAEEQQAEPEDDPEVVYRHLMESARGRLDEREESILHRRFGTGGFDVSQSLREIAADMGISKERVRQIQVAAMDKLRKVAAEMNLLPTPA